MTTRSISADERRALLEDLTTLGPDADLADPLTSFLPLPEHDRCLDPQVLLIRGERGAGKTALFHVLGEMDQRNIPWVDVFPKAPQRNARWVEGFSERGTEHPSANALVLFARGHDDVALRLLWLGHLAGALAEATSTPLPARFFPLWQERRAEPAAWTTLLGEEVGVVESWFERLDRRLLEEERLVFVSYDHLDKVGTTDPTARDRLVAALLALWLSLSLRYRMIRGKLFLREDLFQKGLKSSTDATKLKARSVSLSWTTENLYRVVIRHMANQKAGRLRGWLQRSAKVPLLEQTRLGFLPPVRMPPEEGEGFKQLEFATALAGLTMGEGVNKGYVHRWIPNRLQDAHQTVLPRSMLNLFVNAAEQALQRGPRGIYERLFKPEELQAGLEATSLYRVRELAEEYPVVERMERLRGLIVMAERSEVVSRLAIPVPVGQDDGFGKDGEVVLDELMRLGVAKLRADNRIDVPDLYRYSYGIKRRGGVARPR